MADRMPNLIAAFRLGRRELVAFVGAGGKTSLMLELARQLEAASRVVRLGTTTSVGAAEVAELRHFVYDREVDGRLVGAPVEHFDRLMRLGWIEIAGVEADHSAGRPATAPGEQEPVIPRATTHVIAVIGADALDRVIEDVGHRPMRIASIVGCGPYERLTPERAARLLLSERGGRKGIPAMARFSVAVTKVRSEDDALVERLTLALHEVEPTMAVVRVPFGAGIAAAPPERVGVG